MALVVPTPNPEPHSQQVLKQQQQRLLLLRHASKCPHENNKCTVTPHCANMKTLWKHIKSCKDQDCKTPHCLSSRYVLSHYSKCKDPVCPVCGPVREAIRRNYDWGKQVVGEVIEETPPRKRRAAPAPELAPRAQPTRLYIDMTNSEDPMGVVVGADNTPSVGLGFPLDAQALSSKRSDEDEIEVEVVDPVEIASSRDLKCPVSLTAFVRPMCHPACKHRVDYESLKSLMRADRTRTIKCPVFGCVAQWTIDGPENTWWREDTHLLNRIRTSSSSGTQGANIAPEVIEILDDLDAESGWAQPQQTPQSLSPQVLYNSPQELRDRAQAQAQALRARAQAQAQYTEEQQKQRERQRSIQMHLTLVSHAAQCGHPNCPSRNCVKMKEFLRHESTCPKKGWRGCTLCSRVSNLLMLHARQCQEESCNVPKCREINTPIRDQTFFTQDQIRRKQEMDDSSRRMINDS